MKIISDKRCIIGEGPIWNNTERRLYYTNGMANEICILDIYTGKLEVRTVDKGVAAFAFDKNNRLIVSKDDGVFILNNDDSVEKLYDTSKYSILYANDMKVGPDGRIYVGTQSGKRKGMSDKIDGKLYSIDRNGNVRILLDNLILSNGLEWSIDEKFFYHTDSATNIVKEYSFDKSSGNIEFTGRMLEVDCIDGFTVDEDNNILAACWGYGYIAVIDTGNFKIKSHIDVPAMIPASCSFAGDNMEFLAIVTASYNADTDNDPNAGYTFITDIQKHGRKPYLFG